MFCSDHKSNNAVIFIEAQRLSTYIPAVRTIDTDQGLAAMPAGSFTYPYTRG